MSLGNNTTQALVTHAAHSTSGGTRESSSQEGGGRPPYEGNHFIGVRLVPRLARFVEPIARGVPPVHVLELA